MPGVFVDNALQCWAAFLVEPIYRLYIYQLRHPDFFLFLLHKAIFIGLKYPKNMLFEFDSRIIGAVISRRIENE